MTLLIKKRRAGSYPHFTFIQAVNRTLERRHSVITKRAWLRPAAVVGVAIFSFGLATRPLFSDEHGEQKGFVANIARSTKENRDFRHVLYTGKHLQLVVMTLQPGEEIGDEVHPDGDQFFRVEEGAGEVSINGHKSPVEAETAIVVPAGARHNIRNTGKGALKLYTVYGPPRHADGTVQKTKAEAETSHEHFEGETSE